MCTISGTPDGVQEAIARVNELVQSVQEHDNGGMADFYCCSRVASTLLVKVLSLAGLGCDVIGIIQKAITIN